MWVETELVKPYFFGAEISYHTFGLSSLRCSARYASSVSSWVYEIALVKALFFFF